MVATVTTVTKLTDQVNQQQVTDFERAVLPEPPTGKMEVTGISKENTVASLLASVVASVGQVEIPPGANNIVPTTSRLREAIQNSLI
jgi:hypothetical protein